MVENHACGHIKLILLLNVFPCVFWEHHKMKADRLIASLVVKWKASDPTEWEKGSLKYE